MSGEEKYAEAYFVLLKLERMDHIAGLGGILGKSGERFPIAPDVVHSGRVQCVLAEYQNMALFATTAFSIQFPVANF